MSSFGGGAKEEEEEEVVAVRTSGHGDAGFEHVAPDVIETERLVMRRLTMGNGKSIYVAGHKDEAHLSVISAVTQRIETEAKRIEYIKDQLQQWDARLRFQYVVYDKVSGDEVGMMCLFHPAHSPAGAEVGYFVLSHKCRRGYGLELLRGATRVAFTTLKVHRVELRISHLNKASQALAAKAGFQLDGVKREDYQDPTGTIHSTHLFSMLASDGVAKALVATTNGDGDTA